MKNNIAVVFLMCAAALQAQSSADRLVVVPDGTEVIEADFMRGNKEVECIYIPDSVRIISSEAFARCVNLKYVRMSRNIKEIHTAAFEFTISLSKPSLPEDCVVSERAFLLSKDNKPAWIFQDGNQLVYEGTLQSSKNLKNWQNIGTNGILELDFKESRQMFYRAMTE